MTCHVDGARILCRRVDGFARGSILRTPADADSDSKPWSVELLRRYSDAGLVGWIEWLQSLAPGGGTKTLDEIVTAMQRRKVRVVGLSVVPSVRLKRNVSAIAKLSGSLAEALRETPSEDDVQRLVRFYEKHGFARDDTFPSWTPEHAPIMVRMLESA